jgi:site-specific DNA-cytosine methylase
LKEKVMCEVSEKRAMEREYKAGFMCCGMGGGAVGFSAARFRGRTRRRGRFKVAWGIDVDPAALLVFGRLTGAPGRHADLFTAADYEGYHGAPPPEGWTETTAALLEDLPAPDVVVITAPCQGMSRLSLHRHRQQKWASRYRALNNLGPRCVELAIAAWRPKVMLIENVPGLLEKQGAGFFDKMLFQLTVAGYKGLWKSQCLGKIGGLIAARRRVLIQATRNEHPDLVDEPLPEEGLCLYQEALQYLPPPDSDEGGPLHRVGNYHQVTRRRLAAVPAGRDWTALDELRGRKWRRGTLGVVAGGSPLPTITTGSYPHNGAYTVADWWNADRPQSWPEAADGTWHRPLTPLELAVAQGFDPTRLGWGNAGELERLTRTQWRRLIGNALPPPAARVVAERLGRHLMEVDNVR